MLPVIRPEILELAAGTSLFWIAKFLPAPPCTIASTMCFQVASNGVKCISSYRKVGIPSALETSCINSMAPDIFTPPPTNITGFPASAVATRCCRLPFDPNFIVFSVRYVCVEAEKSFGQFLLLDI